MQTRFWRAALIAAPALVMIAGCGSSASPSSTANAGSSHPVVSSTPSAHATLGTTTAPPAGGGGTTQAASIHPGHGTPADAVDGYLSAVLAGNGSLACSYLLSDDTSCPATVSATGAFAIGRTVIDEENDYALVEVVGQLCVSGSCSSNSNPSAGMPTGSESVSQAIADAEVTGDGFSPIVCTESSHGGWYISVNGD
jgi:hypothetical protein